jgi:hypothetical protein
MVVYAYTPLPTTIRTSVPNPHTSTLWRFKSFIYLVYRKGLKELEKAGVIPVSQFLGAYHVFLQRSFGFVSIKSIYVPLER